MINLSGATLAEVQLEGALLNDADPTPGRACVMKLPRSGLKMPGRCCRNAAPDPFGQVITPEKGYAARNTRG